MKAAPADLSPASRKAWKGLAADLAVVQEGPPADVDLMLLADLLRARDRLAAVGAQLAEDGMTVAGSTGQLRAHPLLAAEAELRKEVAQALDRLGLAPRRHTYFHVNEDGRLEQESYGDEEEGYDE